MLLLLFPSILDHISRYRILQMFQSIYLQDINQNLLIFHLFHFFKKISGSYHCLWHTYLENCFLFRLDSISLIILFFNFLLTMEYIQYVRNCVWECVYLIKRDRNNKKRNVSEGQGIKKIIQRLTNSGSENECERPTGRRNCMEAVKKIFMFLLSQILSVFRIKK